MVAEKTVYGRCLGTQSSCGADTCSRSRWSQSLARSTGEVRMYRTDGDHGLSVSIMVARPARPGLYSAFATPSVWLQSPRIWTWCRAHSRTDLYLRGTRRRSGASLAQPDTDGLAAACRPDQGWYDRSSRTRAAFAAPHFLILCSWLNPSWLIDLGDQI
jgi:hypothetical protein